MRTAAPVLLGWLAGCLSAPAGPTTTTDAAAPTADATVAPADCILAIDFASPAALDTWIRTVDGTTCSCDVVEARLEFANDGATCACELGYPTQFDLTAQAVSVEVAAVEGELDASLLVGLASGEAFLMARTDGAFAVLRCVAGECDPALTTLPFNHELLRYWRIRWLDGTLRFETSADRRAWTERHAVARSAAEASSAALGLASYEDDAVSGRVAFDDLWMCPP